MARKKNRRKKNGLIIAFLIVALSLFFLPFKKKDNFFSRFVLSLTMVSHDIVEGTFSRIASWWGNYLFLVGVEKENKMLRSKLSHLEGREAHLLELTLENARLRQLLGFKAKLPLTTLPAQVVGRDPTNWFKTVLINKGSYSNVPLKAAIVTHAGLVGQVLETSGIASKVLLITDHSSRVSVLVQRTRAEGVLAGTGKAICQVEYLSRLADVREGDVLITSGLGGVFPKGLAVGEVVSVKKEGYGLFQQVEVKPAADLSRLEEVLVVIKKAYSERSAPERE